MAAIRPTSPHAGPPHRALAGAAQLGLASNQPVREHPPTGAASGVEIVGPADKLGSRRPSTGEAMCRNIRPLFNFEPPATDDEIRAAALQFVRKISGYTHPSHANAAAFDRAVDDVARAARALIASLVTTAEPRDREREAEKARARGRARFGAAR
jgi:hypothetical protein